MTEAGAKTANNIVTIEDTKRFGQVTVSDEDGYSVRWEKDWGNDVPYRCIKVDRSSHWYFTRRGLFKAVYDLTVRDPKKRKLIMICGRPSRRNKLSHKDIF